MEGWRPDAAPGFGWPLGERAWVNPSPNAPNLWMARAYAGTVMLEGHDAIRGARHHAAARAVRRARYRRAAVIEGNERRSRRMARGLPPARVLVRADVSQARGQALRRRADPHRRPRLRSPRVPALAPAGACLQGDASPLSRLPALARFRLRVRTTTSSRSTSSTAARCCANGSTIGRRRRTISTRSRCPTSRPGPTSDGHFFATEEPRTQIDSPASWPGLSRPSTPSLPVGKNDVDARDKRGHDEEIRRPYRSAHHRRNRPPGCNDIQAFA